MQISLFNSFRDTIFRASNVCEIKIINNTGNYCKHNILHSYNVCDQLFLF